eukprot:TRINITY_DN55510_c0_g1_i1.p1 TRINITY_DN55510_c0_g1~~TRINITY_DN55510_c0_g1_i1.p1  ORF type:complete len:872 (+),score=167.95 TRINITY_DN55510_c0_g1_i1:202-2817(+)
MSGYPKDRNGGGGGSSGNQKFPPPKEVPSKRREMRADFLLNFQRPANQRSAPASNSGHRGNHYGSGSGGGRRRGGNYGNYATAFTKGRFVQNSFRLFVESSSQDVVEAAHSADSILGWGNVRRVDLLCDEHPKCPICLEEDMLVPKITRCGHVFCLPCIMRYLTTLQDYNGKGFQRCPVCNEPVTSDDLTSLRLQMVRPLGEGDSLNMVLAHRDRDATTVWIGRELMPREADDSCEGGMEDIAHRSTASADRSILRLPTERDYGWHLGRLLHLAPGEVDRLLVEEVEALRFYRPEAIRAGDTELLPSIDASVAMLQRRQRERGGGEGSSRASSSSVVDHAPPSSKCWGCRYVEIPGDFPDHGSCAFSRGSGHSADRPSVQMPGSSTERFGVECYSAAEDRDGSHSCADLPQAAVSVNSDWDADEHEHGVGVKAARKASSADSAGGDDGGVFGGGDGDDSAATGSQVASPIVKPLSDLTENSKRDCTNVPAGSRGRQTTGGVIRGAISHYQLADGRLVFLQPFFTRLILHEHGGRWDSLPPALLNLRVERTQEVTIWDDTRRRHRFLAHLPLGSSVVFVDVDLRGRLSRETVDKFAEEFAKRRQQQKREQIKEKKEDRISKSRAAAEEQKYYQEFNRLAPSMMQALPTKDDFAVDLHGRAPAEPTAGRGGDEASGGSGGEGAELGPTMAEKIKEQMAAKKTARGRGRGSAASGSGAGSGRGSSNSGNPAPVGCSKAAAPIAADFPELGGSGGRSDSAWGRGRGGAKAAAKDTAAPQLQRRGRVLDSWEDLCSDSDDAPAGGGEAVVKTSDVEEEPSFGTAIEAALQRSIAEAAEPGRSANGDIEVDAPTGVAEVTGKKKKGKPKAKTIRLFG